MIPCTGVALSSSVAAAPMTADVATACIDFLRRVEHEWREYTPTFAEWSNLSQIDVQWSATPGAIPADPQLAIVIVVETLPDAAAQAAGDEAYHSEDDQGRPVSYVLWTGDWEDFMHELGEMRINGILTRTISALFGNLNPQGLDEPVEICDRLQVTPYLEPGTTVKAANAATPAMFQAASAGPWDLAGVATGPFWQSPGGYHETISADGATVLVFGEKVSDEDRARIERTGPRAGTVRAARKAA